MSPAPLGLLLDFAAADTPHPLLDGSLYSHVFLGARSLQKSGLGVRFAEVKEEPQKGGGHVAKRIADPRW